MIRGWLDDALDAFVSWMLAGRVRRLVVQGWDALRSAGGGQS